MYNGYEMTISGFGSIGYSWGEKYPSHFSADMDRAWLLHVAKVKDDSLACEVQAGENEALTGFNIETELCSWEKVGYGRPYVGDKGGMHNAFPCYSS